MAQQLEIPKRSAPAQAPATLDSRSAQRRRSIVDLGLFVAQRLAFGAVILIFITYLTFLGLDMARGLDLQTAAPIAARKSVEYLLHLVQGVMGMPLTETVTPRAQPISTILGGIVAKSMGLLAVSMLISTVVGVGLGMLAGRRRNANSSLLILLLSIIGVSVPSFFAALLLQLLMIQWVKRFGAPLFPTSGFGWDRHVILPALVLAARPIAQITRVTFLTVGSVLGSDYVRTATSKGLWPRHVWSRHVMRNVAVPVLTTIGLSLRFSLSSLPVVEYFFAWPGIGFTLLRSISRQDDILTVTLILCLGVLFIVVNLLLDVSYRLIDPRLREPASGMVRRQGYAGLTAGIESLLASLKDLVVYNLVRNWLASRKAEPVPDPFRQVSESLNGSSNGSADLSAYRAERRRSWVRGTAGNAPLMLGLLLVAALMAVVFAGPRLAPHNPYTTQALSIVNGKSSVPPFAPSDVHPWGTDVLGRDIMSLVLVGAQQTLILAALAMLARLLVGFTLGAIAGWRNGGWLDRLIVGASEVIAAYPALVLAMVVILALGIRQGVRPFIIALCLVGWGEVMQFVRGEVMVIRKQPYIESATAVGVRTSRMIVAHVLPVLLAALISIAALEMGAVLMLLGELGFVSIFIGGGAFAELDVGAALFHYSDVPEWGSLLSGARLYARGYPWVALYPATAFFIAIVGFNLFGEGLRRAVESVGIGFGRLFNRYTLAVMLLALAGIAWARNNTGGMAFYQQQAAQFDGQKALAYVEQLSDPALENRSLGTPGIDRGADWIAEQFSALGVQPAGEKTGYFQNGARSFESLTITPTLQIADGGAQPVYRQDFTEFAGRYRNLGKAAGPVKVVLAKDLKTGSMYDLFPALTDAVNPDDVVLVLSDKEAAYLQETDSAGILIVSDDPKALDRSLTLSTQTSMEDLFGTGRTVGKDPIGLLISAETANRILASRGQTVESLRQEREKLDQNEVGIVTTPISVTMEVTGTLSDKAPARHVLGIIPGVSGRAAPGEAQMDDKLIVVEAQYDSPPPSLDGCCPAANDNASGVAVMLEAIRVLQELGYQPYRTLLFVAYSGEGLEGGNPVRPEDVKHFLQAKTGYATAFEVESIVHLRGLGTGAGDGVVISAGGNQRLAKLFERSARQVGLRTKRAEEAVDISIVFSDRSDRQGGGQEAPMIRLSWEGWEVTSRTAEDTSDAISQEKLQKAGRALAQALMVMGREENY